MKTIPREMSAPQGIEKVLDFFLRLRLSGYHREADYYGWTFRGKRFRCYEKENGKPFIRYSEVLKKGIADLLNH